MRREEESNPALPILDICYACDRLPTKPEMRPTHLAGWISVASELFLIQSAGGTFAYPDALDELEWLALRALTAGRAASQAKEQAKREAEAEIQREESRLTALARSWEQ